MFCLLCLGALALPFHLLDTNSYLLYQTKSPALETNEPILQIHKHVCIKGQGFITDIENLFCTQFKNGDCLCMNLGTGVNTAGQAAEIAVLNLSDPSAIVSNIFSNGSLQIRFSF